MVDAARRDSIRNALTQEEKALLTAGADLWSTVAVPRVGVPAVGLTDGPNGARGAALPGAETSPSACTPCGSALGATWDPELVGRVAEVVGREARAKGCHVLLAPTVNLHRSPLGGRTFESFSEDPWLTGSLAVGYIRGAQRAGVAATVKHLVANEAEQERMTADSVVDERTLRELYLVPFERAVKEGSVMAVMTAYNRLNGRWCADHGPLLEILREEWGFRGVVMTDWFAGAHTVEAALAGLDLEMPGPGRAFGPELDRAVRDGVVPPGVLDAKVDRLLELMDRLGVLDPGGSGGGAPAGAGRAGPPAPPPADGPADRATLRTAAAASMVLLTNRSLLPLDAGALRSVAVIGPNAARAQIGGGGSAQVRPHHRTTPLDALRRRLGEQVALDYERGCVIDRVPPVIDGTRLRTPAGAPGMAVEWFADAAPRGTPVVRTVAPETMLIDLDGPLGVEAGSGRSLRATAVFTPVESGPHTVTFAQVGRGRLLVDGAVVHDGTVAALPAGTLFFGAGSIDLVGEVELSADRSHELVVEVSSQDHSTLIGFRVGCQPVVGPDLLQRAVDAAARADAAVVVVGTTDEWEREGRDRSALELPGAQDQLVAAVVAANPRTVVVVNAGSPVTMPWADDAGAVLQCWFGGQEMADALVDVLLGDADPGGRLPTTIPHRIEDTPAYGMSQPENHVVRYGERVLIGYRWYDARKIPVRFPFGHGLSYANFTIGAATLSRHEMTPGSTVVVGVPVTNVGPRGGDVVVQCYVAPLGPPVLRPPKELKAFAKAHLGPEESVELQLELDQRAFAYYHTGDGDAVADLRLLPGMTEGAARPSGRPAGWEVAAGTYEVLVARSAADVVESVRVEVPEGFRIVDNFT